jgi:hypothetical protein
MWLYVSSGRYTEASGRERIADGWWCGAPFRPGERDRVTVNPAQARWTAARLAEKYHGRVSALEPAPYGIYVDQNGAALARGHAGEHGSAPVTLWICWWDPVQGVAIFEDCATKTSVPIAPLTL